MIGRLALRLARDLALVPVAAFLVHLGVAQLPMREIEVKQTAAASVARAERDRRRADMGLDRPLTGFVRPWEKLAQGRTIGVEMREDLRSLGRRLGGSLGNGALALLLSLCAAGAYAAARIALARRAAGDALGFAPVLVFATPTFVLAYAAVVAVGANAASGSNVLAAVILSVAPAAFLGTVLHGAFAAEMARPYVVAARARGRGRAGVLVRHVLPNALPALLDALPPVATALLVGSFVVEQAVHVELFGFLYVEAARQREVELVVVCTTAFVALLVLVTAAVEVARLAVDPKARAAFLEGRS